MRREDERGRERRREDEGGRGRRIEEDREGDRRKEEARFVFVKWGASVVCYKQKPFGSYYCIVWVCLFFITGRIWYCGGGSLVGFSIKGGMRVWFGVAIRQCV